MIPSVTLAPLARTEVARVMHLQLPAAQHPYVGAIAEMASDPDPLQDFHYVAANGQIVGFFKIDKDFSRRIKRLPTGAHALRGVLIGGQYQGQGLGRAMMMALPKYLRARYQTPDLWLSVDEANAPAIHLYHATGWSESGPRFAGRSGMELVMRLTLT